MCIKGGQAAELASCDQTNAHENKEKKMSRNEWQSSRYHEKLVNPIKVPATSTLPKDTHVRFQFTWTFDSLQRMVFSAKVSLENRSSFPIFHELEYLLVNFNKKLWKITMLSMGKSTISTGPFSIAILAQPEGRSLRFPSYRLPIEPRGSHRDHTLNGLPGSGVAGFAFRQLRKHLILGKFWDLPKW
jgi:hypothetical protein